MARGEQAAFAGKGFEQEQHRRIENLADKYDDARQLVMAATKDRANAEFKLMEEMFRHVQAKDISVQTSPLGAITAVYRFGDYNIVIKGGQMHANVKIKQASKPAGVPAVDTPVAQEEGAETDA